MLAFEPFIPTAQSKIANHDIEEIRKREKNIKKMRSDLLVLNNIGSS